MSDDGVKISQHTIGIVIGILIAIAVGAFVLIQQLAMANNRLAKIESSVQDNGSLGSLQEMPVRVALEVTNASGTLETIPLERGLGEILAQLNANDGEIMSGLIRIYCGMSGGKFVPPNMEGGKYTPPSCQLPEPVAQPVAPSNP